MINYYRKCPECEEIQIYKNKYSHLNALKNNIKCRSCVRIEIHRKHNNIITNDIGKLIRYCSKCNEKIIYKTLGGYKYALKNNSLCNSCSSIGNKAFTGYTQTNEAKKKIRESKLGDKNPTKCPKVRKKISISKKNNFKNIEYKNWFVDNVLRNKQRCDKISSSLMGRKLSDEHKKNCRLAAIKRIENTKGQCSPNYNSEACKIIDEYGKKYDFNFQHAENGGEVCIDGYFPDGLDGKRKTIIEIDEPYHFDNNGNLRQKDIERQNYLENLGYKFIRVRI